MFEKHRTNKPESTRAQSQRDNFSATTQAPSSSGRAAVIGPGIQVNGDIVGDENLVIEGRVQGKIRLDAHQVEVGQSGKVKADITAKVIKVAGEVRGDLVGTEKVIILCSGNVHGNIVAPRMTLEDGAIFKGSIDMDPGEPVKAKTPLPVKQPIAKTPEKTAETPKAATGDSKAKGSSGYSLHGG